MPFKTGFCLIEVALETHLTIFFLILTFIVFFYISLFQDIYYSRIFVKMFVTSLFHS